MANDLPATAPAAAAPAPAVVPGSEPLPAVPAGTTIDTLLTPNPGDTDPQFAHFGTLAVERSHLGEFEQAQRYLAKDPEAVAALHALETAKDPHTVRFIDDGDDRYNHNTNTLYWDPKSALTNTDGSTQSAALGLLHEEGHLIEHQQNPRQYFDGLSDPTPRAYGNREEQRVIEGLENRAATALGEGIRHDHAGTPFNAKDPVSRTPEAPHRAAGVGLPDAINTRIAAGRAEGGDMPPRVASADAVRPWDGKTYTGSFVHIDDATAAQHVGRGNYVVYDVRRDLGGVTPPESNRDVTVDARGNVNVPAPAERERVSER